MKFALELELNHPMPTSIVPFLRSRGRPRLLDPFQDLSLPVPILPSCSPEMRDSEFAANPLGDVDLLIDGFELSAAPSLAARGAWIL